MRLLRHSGTVLFPKNTVFYHKWVKKENKHQLWGERALRRFLSR